MELKTKHPTIMNITVLLFDGNDVVYSTKRGLKKRVGMGVHNNSGE
jgi:hypothetical protein